MMDKLARAMSRFKHCGRLRFLRKSPLGKHRIVALFVLISCFPTMIVGQQTPSVGQDEGLALIKAGQRVKLVLKTGTFVEGKVVDLVASTLTLDVRNSDNLKDVAKGRQTLALDRVASVTFSIYKGNKRKWLPAILVSTLGAFSLVVAGGTASEEGNSTYFPLAVKFTAGLGLAGYYGGRAMDRHEVTTTLK